MYEIGEIQQKCLDQNSWLKLFNTFLECKQKCILQIPEKPIFLQHYFYTRQLYSYFLDLRNILVSLTNKSHILIFFFIFVLLKQKCGKFFYQLHIIPLVQQIKECVDLEDLPLHVKILSFISLRILKVDSHSIKPPPRKRQSMGLRRVLKVEVGVAGQGVSGGFPKPSPMQLCELCMFQLTITSLMFYHG